MNETTQMSADDSNLIGPVRRTFQDVAGGGRPVFCTAAGDIWAQFLPMLPEQIRQQHNCRACRRFVDTFGHLVVIDDDGATRPLMWSTAPEPFRAAFEHMAGIVRRASVTGVFLARESVWGTPSNQDAIRGVTWHHMHVVPPDGMRYKGPLITTPEQAMAAIKEDFRMLRHGLAEYPLEVVRNAKALLDSGKLDRPEKCQAVATWLIDLHEKREAVGPNPVRRDNVVWQAVATAPAGFCHVRSGMIGTLLEDIQAGHDFEAIRRRYNEKMHPLQYQRPTAPPAAGQIAAAEKVVAALQTAGALMRRFARMEDIRPFWTSAPMTPDKPAGEGVFSHLQPKGKRMTLQTVDAGNVTVTWVKFAAQMLMSAAKIEVQVAADNNPFIALTTASNPDAPPILQWDRDDARNPVSWYVYMGGVSARNWNTAPGWQEVTALTYLPPMWTANPLPSWGEGVIFIIRGLRDMQYRGGALFFPEQLRSEYHPVRKTMEAYARQGRIEGMGDPLNVAGYDLRKGSLRGARVRVTDRNGLRTTYLIDRWD